MRVASISRCHKAWAARSFATASANKKVVVLGGTGFVGQQVCEKLTKTGRDVVSGAVKHISADLVRDPEQVRSILQDEGPVDAVVHAIGMLLPNEFNKYASGSGSVPSPGTTFDQITRRSAVTAAEALSEVAPGAPFCFVSAAEAGWTWDPPILPGFLKDYLAAKRTVEARLQELGAAGLLRPTILRPSLIWSPSRPAALPAVAAFTAANAIRVPGIDRPVSVDVLSSAAVYSVTHDEVSGFQNFEAMEALAAKPM